MTKLKTVIVEDHQESLADLKHQLDRFDFIEVLAEARDGLKAVEVIDSCKPDLLLLDVQLPELNGFQVLERIQYHPMVIFISAYDHYAVKAFEVNSVDYILKPISGERLHTALERVRVHQRSNTKQIKELLQYVNQKKSQEKYFCVKDQDQILIIPLDEVYYFKAQDKYTFLHTSDNGYFYPGILQHLHTKTVF